MPMEGRKFRVRRHCAVDGFEFDHSSKVATFVGHHANVVVLDSAKRPATKFPCGPPLATMKSSPFIELIDMLYSTATLTRRRLRKWVNGLTMLFSFAVWCVRSNLSREVFAGSAFQVVISLFA